MKRVSVVLVLCLLLVSCTSAPSETDHTERIDQFVYYENGGGGLEITAIQTVIQTFTVGITGVLTRIIIPRLTRHSGTTDADLQIRLLKMNDSIPLSTELAAFAVSPDQVSFLSDSSNALDLILSEVVPVRKGDYLGIELRCDCSPSGATYAWSGELDAYLGGTAIINGRPNLRDMVFVTYVRP